MLVDAEARWSLGKSPPSHFFFLRTPRSRTLRQRRLFLYHLRRSHILESEPSRVALKRFRSIQGKFSSMANKVPAKELRLRVVYFCERFLHLHVFVRTADYGVLMTHFLQNLCLYSRLDSSYYRKSPKSQLVMRRSRSSNDPVSTINNPKQDVFSTAITCPLVSRTQSSQANNTIRPQSPTTSASHPPSSGLSQPQCLQLYCHTCNNYHKCKRLLVKNPLQTPNRHKRKTLQQSTTSQSRTSTARVETLSDTCKHSLSPDDNYKHLDIHERKHNDEEGKPIGCASYPTNSPTDKDSNKVKRRHHIPPHRPHVLWTALLFCLVQVCGTVTVIGPPWPEPVFLPRLLNVTVREGGRALLPCAVHYLGTRQVTWRLMGEHHFLSVGDMPWVKDPNLQMEFRELTPEVTEWNLIIRNVTPAHEGTYECKISDKNELLRHVHLRVVGPPLVKEDRRPPIAVSGKNYVETGEPIRLFCNVSGPNGMYLKIDWFKDGDSMQYPSPRNAIITNYNLVETNVLVSELFIDRSRASDSGTYICRSTMGIKSIKVTVLFADTSNVKRADSTGDPESESLSSRLTCLGFPCLLAWTALVTVISNLLTCSRPVIVTS